MLPRLATVCCEDVQIVKQMATDGHTQFVVEETNGYVIYDEDSLPSCAMELGAVTHHGLVVRRLRRPTT